MKELKGLLVYRPKGPAGEYAKWAVNLYNGCVHGCTYCYNRRGVLRHAFGNEVTLAAPIRRLADKMEAQVKKECETYYQTPRWAVEYSAVQKILKEDICNRLKDTSIKEDGVFLSFTCDPLHKSCLGMTEAAIQTCIECEVPVTLLTKSVDWLPKLQGAFKHYKEEEIEKLKKYITVGFTITGMDEEEVNAPSTSERIEALSAVAELGMRTFVSLEPIIDLQRALDVYGKCIKITNGIRFGLLSPYKKGRYGRAELIQFLTCVHLGHRIYKGVKVVAKDSIIKECDRLGIMLANDFRLIAY